MRRPRRINRPADLQEPRPFLILLGVEYHVSAGAIVARAGISRLHKSWPTEEFRASGQIERVHAMKIISVGVLGHGHNIDGPMWSTRAVDDRRGGHTNLRSNLAAPAVIAGGLAGAN